MRLCLSSASDVGRLALVDMNSNHYAGHHRLTSINHPTNN
jgi:hypothetical protein